MRLGVGCAEMLRAWVWVSVSDCGRRVGVQPWLTGTQHRVRVMGSLRVSGVGEQHVGVYEGRSEQVVM